MQVQALDVAQIVTTFFHATFVMEATRSLLIFVQIYVWILFQALILNMVGNASKMNVDLFAEIFTWLILSNARMGTTSLMMDVQTDVSMSKDGQ